MGHKILLADDSITIQKVIELTFTDEDFELHTVGNGQKAIEEIRTVKPDIVLCDIIMPEKSGYEVCEHIKTSDDLKHIPVLLLTGAFEPFDQERAKQAGCDGFLAKPFEPQTLISKVKELLTAPAQAPSPGMPASEPAPQETATVTPGTPAPPAAVPSAPSANEPEDATVMMSSPDMGGGSPPAATPAPEAPPALVAPVSSAPDVPPASPEPAAPPEGAGFQENFAVGAGERELSVDSDDRTMFLGQEPAGGSSDDIWNEVQNVPSEPAPPAPAVPTAPPAPPVVPAVDEESQTVMMSAPVAPEPPPTPEAPPLQAPQEPPGFLTPPDTIDPHESKDVQGPEDVPTSAGFTELPTTSVDGPGEDNPWVIPGPDEPAPTAQPEPPGSSGQSGQSGQAAGTGSGGSIVGAESAEPELTPLGDFGGFDDFSADQQAPPGVTEQAGSGAMDEPVPPVPVVPTPPSPVPTFTPDPIPPAASVGASPADPIMPAHPVQDDEPFAELAPTVPPSGGLPETPSPPAGLAEGSTQGVSSAGAPGGDGVSAEGIGDKDMDELADKIAKKVLSQLSEKVIQEIAWEVVPDLAEALIQKEIAEIKAKIPK